MNPWPYPLWIAHRGAGKLAPENTLAAFRLGSAHGYRAFECDVKLSADGVPFLLHDATLERTTDGQGPAGALPWGELSQRDAGSWHGRMHAGEPMPTLAAIAAFVRRNRCLLNIELKPSPGAEERTGRVVAEQARRLWPAAEVPPLLSSFRPESLLGAREGAPELPRALLLDSLWPGWFEMARNLACAAVVAQHGLVDAALVGQVHEAGLRVLAYTVNERADADRLLRLGTDGLITDAIDVFAPGES